jgi:hypothetical protein
MECEHLIYLNREGSQLAISLFCDIVLGVHPVEAFYQLGWILFLEKDLKNN